MNGMECMTVCASWTKEIRSKGLAGIKLNIFRPLLLKIISFVVEEETTRSIESIFTSQFCFGLFVNEIKLSKGGSLTQCNQQIPRSVAVQRLNPLTRQHSC